jgi:hypothetical protein
MNGVQFLGGAMMGFVLFSTFSRLAVGPTLSPVQRGRGALSLGVKQQGMKLSTHIYLLPRLICGVITTLSYVFMVLCLIKQWIHLHGMVLS